MARRFTDDGRRIPTGVTFDKERGMWRATFKGWSVKFKTFDEAVEGRKALVKEGKPHPSYVARMKSKKTPK